MTSRRGAGRLHARRAAPSREAPMHAARELRRRRARVPRRATSSAPATRSSRCARCPSAASRSRRPCARDARAATSPRRRRSPRAGRSAPTAGHPGAEPGAEDHDDLQAVGPLHRRRRGRGHDLGDDRAVARGAQDELSQRQGRRSPCAAPTRRPRRARRAEGRALLRHDRAEEHGPQPADRHARLGRRPAHHARAVRRVGQVRRRQARRSASRRRGRTSRSTRAGA